MPNYLALEIDELREATAQLILAGGHPLSSNRDEEAYHRQIERRLLTYMSQCIRAEEIWQRVKETRRPAIAL